MRRIKRVRTIAVVLTLFALALISPSLHRFEVRAGCGASDGGNANGHYHIDYNCRICIDPNTGLIVEYVVYGPPTWTTNDSVVHTFGVLTCDDDDQICATYVESARGTSSDGQFTILLERFTAPTIWDSNGVEVMSP